MTITFNPENFITLPHLVQLEVISRLDISDLENFRVAAKSRNGNKSNTISQIFINNTYHQADDKKKWKQVERITEMNQVWFAIAERFDFVQNKEQKLLLKEGEIRDTIIAYIKKLSDRIKKMNAYILDNIREIFDVNKKTPLTCAEIKDLTKFIKTTDTINFFKWLYIYHVLTDDEELRQIIISPSHEIYLRREETRASTLNAWAERNKKTLAKIITVDFEASECFFLPNAIGYFTGVEILKLNGNNITVLPMEISKLTNLRELELDLNKLFFKELT